MSPGTALIAALISFFADAAVILAFIIQAKQHASKAAMAEGKHQQIVEEMKHDLDRCHEKIRAFEGRLNAADVSVGEMKADIRHILESASRIESKLDEHISKGSGE